MKRFNKTAGTLALLLTLVLTTSARSSSPKPTSRDYLTPKEIELVKDAQVLDERIDVFIKAAERRFLVLSGQTTSAPTSKKEQKEADKWGELPKGTRAELITDIAGILDAAIENIDDVALRDEKNPLIPKSLKKLAAAATRFQAQLTSMQGQAKEAAERTAIEQALENVQEILEAAAKLQSQPAKK